MAAEVRPLTGVRGIAASLVVLYHLSHLHILPPVLAIGIVNKGYLAVDLFFILSGFVLGLRYGESFKFGVSNVLYREFLRKRLARIYPLYLVVNLIALFKDVGRSFIHDGMVYSSWEIVGNFLMVQSWGLGMRSISGPTWSLSAEFFAYLAFPLLVAVSLRAKGVALFLFTLACATAVTLVSLSDLGVRGPMDVVAPESLLPLLRCVSEFCLGLLAYQATQADPVKRLMSSDIVTVSVLAVIVFGTMFYEGDLLIVFVMPLLIVNLYSSGRTANILFANRATYHLGMISYSIYLVHPILLGFPIWLATRSPLAGLSISDVVATTLYLLAVWAAAFLCYKFIERPGMRLGIKHVPAMQRL